MLNIIALRLPARGQYSKSYGQKKTQVILRRKENTAAIETLALNHFGIRRDRFKLLSIMCFTLGPKKYDKKER